MSRLLIALIGLALCGSAQAAMNFASLWRSADQRGQELLDHGDAAAAAQTFHDPRRKAYAELRAGQYQAAAQGFAAFDDSDAHYDRGNALARAGDLQGAIGAYDAALAKDPHNQDARHNRELVQKALEQQKQQQQQQKSGQPGSQGHNGRQKQSQDQDQNSPNPQGDDQQRKEQQGKEQQGKDQQESNQQASDQQGKDQQGKDQQAGEQKAQQQQPQEQQPPDQNPPGEQAQAAKQPSSQNPVPQDSRAEAEQDARAPQRTPAQAASAQNPSPVPSPPDEQSNAKPMTEQQLAQEQWLRRIPDDPGGLLRRKFMNEYLMRQQLRQQGSGP